MPERNFQHIDDTGFPYPEGINPYKYKNDFDYSKYDKTQMRITVCSVPWDVGLIHVGNAQIGGLGNVVYFESKEARDEWLDSLENKYTWETEYREYHTDGHIKVPLPYEKAVQYNYVYVEYTRLPVEYSEGGKDRFFFFIRQCSSDAPSTCDIEILRDTFQTFIYDVHVSHIMLERGHAPMSLVDADKYLADPINNNAYLLAEDVNFGTTYQRTLAGVATLNSSAMWCVFVTSGNPQTNWGSKADANWFTPDGNIILDGQLAYHAVAIETGDLATFLDNVNRNMPQFFQTVKGVFFIAKNLVSTSGNDFEFGGVTCRRLVQKTSTIDFLELTKSQFNYGSKYRDIAKLYTYPYAFLEVADDNGNITQIRIEETSGELSLTVTSSLAYPWINLDGRLNGIGYGKVNLSFFNAKQHLFEAFGDFANYLYKWDIPIFGVMQANSTYNDFATHFDRLQQANENITAKTNADANATIAKANADANAATSKANADAYAATMQTNANASAATSNTNAKNAAATNRNNFTEDRLLVDDYFALMFDIDMGFPDYALKGLAGGQSKINRVKLEDDRAADDTLQWALTYEQNEQTVSTTTMNGVGSAVQQTIGGAISGGAVGGGIGAIGGAVTGLVSGAMTLATSTASLPIIQSTNADITEATIAAADAKTSNAYIYTENMVNLQRAYEIRKKAAENQHLTANANRLKTYADNAADLDLQTAQGNALREYNTAIANNTRTYNTALANATRTLNNALAINERNKTIADQAIVNQQRQAALMAPREFGSFANGDHSTTRPMGLFAQIVTQPKDAIEQAGDYFLRFGYAVNRAWDFTTFNLMPKFTYWKASDMWVSGNNVPDAYLDEIRFFFLGGVTVWRNPDDIGNISIYENK